MVPVPQGARRASISLVPGAVGLPSGPAGQSLAAEARPTASARGTSVGIGTARGLWVGPSSAWKGWYHGRAGDLHSYGDGVGVTGQGL